MLSKFPNKFSLHTDQKILGPKSAMSSQDSGFSQCRVDSQKLMYTSKGGHFNWCLECLGDRAAHSTEREGPETGSQVIWLMGYHPHKTSNLKHSGLRVSQDGPVQ